jgi:hypothetical protein
MPDFMLLIHESEASGAALAPLETRALLESQAAYEQKLRAAGAYGDGERLRPSAEGRRVRRSEEGPHVEVGPFADPTLGGYYVLQAANLDAALELAEQCPVSPGVELELRPVMKGHFEPDKTGQQGRVFAFGVLGSAANEQAWIDVMDRIDERTQDHFPADRFRGGVRLEAPGRGRRVSSTGGRRAVFDGPFLESKEVIGGLFFMRMANLDEAVEWAGQSEFVRFGTLEIRELWRS